MAVHIDEGALRSSLQRLRESAFDVFAAGAGVDALHAASMLMLAGADRTARRAALTDAAVEAAFAATGLAVAVSSGDRPGRRTGA